MKLTVVSIIALGLCAAAQPHHRNLHPAKKRDVNINVVTDIVYATEAAAVVYVDQNGQPWSTSFGDQPAETQAPVQQAYGPPSWNPSQQQPPAYGPPSSDAPPAPDSTAAPAPSYSSPDNSPPAHSGSPSGGGPGSGGADASGYSLSYTPYNGDNSCKTQDQINADFAAFSGISMVRIYGTDCDQVNTVLNAAKTKGIKVFAGVYDIDQADEETKALISAAQGNWDMIHSVAIGNEAVTNGMASVDQVVGALNQARSTLKAAGFNGPVVTVDTFQQLVDNPALCQASDFAAANCHAFFNSDLTADQAGQWVKEQAERVANACGGKTTMITESGWPSNGETNGNAVPSEANQRIAIDSLKSAFSDNLVLFSAFNDMWKQNSASTFGAEQWWGIYGNAPSS